RDLDREVTGGRFREDLFAALAATRIEIPPLRDREGDVALLARAFWRDAITRTPGTPDSDLPADFLARAQDYSWPGNVRELSTAVYNRFCLGEFGKWWHSEDLSFGDTAFKAVLTRELPLTEAREIVVHEFERRYVRYMLNKHASTKEAAKA